MQFDVSTADGTVTYSGSYQLAENTGVLVIRQEDDEGVTTISQLSPAFWREITETRTRQDRAAGVY